MQSRSLHSETLVASGAVTKHRAVLFTGAQAGAAGVVLGVAEAGAADTEPFAATVIGTAIVEAGAAVSVGAEVASDANGKAVAAAATQYYFGRALEAASADGDLIEVLIERGRLET